MVNKVNYLRFLIGFSLVALISCNASGTNNAENNQEISGTLENGYRVLETRSSEKPVDFTVYRGDYIKFRNIEEGAVLSVPSLKINELLGNPDTFVKMKEAGSYPYTLGDVSGTFYVVEYIQQRYYEVGSQQAADMIRDSEPVILDVRTSMEYRSSHIDGAILIPVQQLQARIGELEQYKNSPILVYCASGNRSTVASKLLIDAGYNNISNLRHGIKDWVRSKFPVVSGR